MTHDHEALRALSNDEVEALSRKLAVLLLEENPLTPGRLDPLARIRPIIREMYPAFAAIHCSALAEDTARAAEDMRERCRALVAAEVARVSAVEADLIAMGGENDSLSYAGQRAALEIMDQAIRALPLTKEAADANR